MFDNNVFIAGTCTNAVENGAVVGYELQTNITYYRGIPLSMVEFIKVEVDGVEADVEDIRISVDHNDWFTMKEAAKRSFFPGEMNVLPIYLFLISPIP